MSVVSSNSTKKGKLSGRKASFIFAIIAALAATILVFAIMAAVTAKETYYVLNQDVPARTLIDQNMLAMVETSAGSAPPTALDVSQIEGQYSLTALKAGDILTTSNIGDQVGLTQGLPKNFVLSSFVANPSIAAGGNVKRGDYVDIIAVVEDEEVTGQPTSAASYLLQRVLVVDATQDLDSFEAETTDTTTGEEGATTEDGTDSGAVGGATARSGVPTMFTVGLAPQDATVLALATKYDLYVVLSSSESTTDGIVPTDVPPIVLSEIWGTPRDAGKGTDNTFGNGGTETETPDGTDEDGVTSPDPQPTEEVTTEG